MSIRLHLCWNKDRLPDSLSLFNSENMTRDDATQTHFPTEQRWMFIWLKWLRKYQIREWIWVKITMWCSTERRRGEEKDKPAYQAALSDVQDKQISIHPCVVMLGEVVVLYSHRCHASVEKKKKNQKKSETSALIWNWSKETFSVLNVGRQHWSSEHVIGCSFNANYKIYVVYTLTRQSTLSVTGFF